jgi:flagellar protein FliS
MKSGYTAYKSTRIDTANQEKLIVMAYDVAIKHCKMGLEVFQDTKKIEERTKHLLRAQDAVTELMSSLRMDVGEIASNLYRLYDYILRRLIHANARGKSDAVEEVLEYLCELREAWNYAAGVVRQQGKASPGQSSGEKKFAISG